MRKLLWTLIEGLGIYLYLTIFFQSGASALKMWMIVYPIFILGNVTGWRRAMRDFRIAASLRRKQRMQRRK